MASMSGANTVQGDLVRAIIAEVKSLTVDRLKRVLKTEQLQVSGVKNELQMRLIAHIHDAQRQSDSARLQRIKDAVRGHSSGSIAANTYNPGAYPSPYSNHTPASSASPQNYYVSPTPGRLPPPPSTNMPNFGTYSSSRLTFKESPFYTIQKQLASFDLKPREQTRDTARLTINLDDQLAARLQNDPCCRAMVFCAAESFETQWKAVDIAFPHHAELKCNGEDVKSNLKGLKGKPGSTRPVDITPFLRKRTGFPNNVELIYALTNKKYYIVVNLVTTKSIDALVADLKRGKYVSRDRVIREMLNCANDDDIVATSSNMSLKDRISMSRIKTPCRSSSCKHNECFDAASYLALQEQAPIWQCPICQRPATWENLVYDQYVQHILESTPEKIDQVTVEPDGQWHLVKADAEAKPPPMKNPFSNRADSYDDDDDLVEIADFDQPATQASIRTRPMIDPVRTPSLNGSASPFALPQQPTSSLLAQSMNQPSSTSKKRPREEVIDLTLDDDDDDDQPPVSRIKGPPFPSQVSDSNRPGATGPYRFNLPPPVPSRNGTSSPADRYRSVTYYDYNDRFNTRL